MTKTPPYSRRLTRWFCDCGREHYSEALAWACGCYMHGRMVICEHAEGCSNEQCLERVEHQWSDDKYESTCAAGYCAYANEWVRCVPVEAKEATNENA